MKASLLSHVQETAIRFHIAASAALCASPETIAQWRRQPIVVAGKAMSASFLKHSEDQTIVAMRAVLMALEESAWTERSFADWGVVAAANFLARATIAQNIARFRREGAWGVSPHLIPHQSLHAVSGTISQALTIHGPNFGVGGGPNAGPDAFLLSAALMADEQLPGLWLVLTGHDAEVIPLADGAPAEAPTCIAVALALSHADQGAGGLHLSIGQADNESLAHLPEFSLTTLVDEWPRLSEMPGSRWRLDQRHWVALATAIHRENGP